MMKANCLIISKITRLLCGPSKNTRRHAVRVIWPTTAGRMDPMCRHFRRLGVNGDACQGNRSGCARVMEQHGGFYLGSIGGVAANLPESIKKVEVLEYPELGMEAVWRIEVENFPAFIITMTKAMIFDLAKIDGLDGCGPPLAQSINWIVWRTGIAPLLSCVIQPILPAATQSPQYSASLSIYAVAVPGHGWL